MRLAPENPAHAGILFCAHRHLKQYNALRGINVAHVKFALYCDLPDAWRKSDREKF